MRWREIITEFEQGSFNVSTITPTKGDEFDQMRTGGGSGQKPPKPPKRRDDEEPPRYTPSFIIPAQIHDDYWLRKVTFEALEWFEQASDEELIELMKCNFRGDYAADAVAEWTSDHDERILAVLEWCQEEGKGFECIVSEAAAHVWLAHYRPHILDPDYDLYS